MPTGSDLVVAARKHLGVPYAIGPGVGKDPAGFDCSGLIWWACRELGVTIPHGSSAQIAHVTPISVAAARAIPGALLWREGHDGLSTGAGVIEARTPRVVEGAWTDTFDGGKTRWTHAGLIPGITYEEAPVPFTITSPYGPRSIVVNGKKQNYPHRGLDLRSREGAARRAIFGGRVVKVTRGRVEGAPIGKDDRNGVKAHASSISGNAVSIERADGRIYTEVHLAPTSGLEVGDTVGAGDLLGHTDKSGGITGAHQHVELWWKWDPNAYYDPTDEITAALTTPAAPTPTPDPSPEEDDMFNDDDRKALKKVMEESARIKQIAEALDVRTGNEKGNLATAARQVGEIHARVNWARRPDGTPYLLSVQGDTDILLRAIAGLNDGDPVDENAIARAVVELLPAGVALDPSALAKAVLDAAASRLAS